MTKKRWCSIDAHFQNGAVTVSLSLLLIKAANTLVIHNSEQIASHLSYLQHWELLMLRWRSFSEWGCDCVAITFAYKGCQYIGNGLLQANCFPINLLTTPKIVVTDFQHGAVTMSLSLLPIKAATRLVVHNSKQISFPLPYLQDLKSLMLRWHSS